MNHDEMQTRQFIRNTFAATAVAPRAGFSERVLRRARPKPQSMVRRPVKLVLLAATVGLLTVVGATSALARTSALGAMLGTRLAEMGLGAAAVQPVDARATDAGMTIRVTNAIRDGSLVILSLQAVAPTNERDWISLSGDETGSNQVIQLVSSSGQVLKPGSAANDLTEGTGQVVVFATADGSPASDERYTLTAYGIERYFPSSAPGGFGGPGHAQVVRGHWTLPLRIPAASDSLQTLSTPSAGQVGSVQVTFTSVRANNLYILGTMDVTSIGQFGLMLDDPAGNLIHPVFTSGLPTPKETGIRGTHHVTFVWPHSTSGTHRIKVQDSAGGIVTREIAVP